MKSPYLFVGILTSLLISGAESTEVEDIPWEVPEAKVRYTDTPRVVLKMNVQMKGTVRIDNKIGKVPITVQVWRKPSDKPDISPPAISRTVYPGDFFERPEVEGSIVVIEAEDSEEKPNYSYFLGFSSIRSTNESLELTTEGATRVTWQIRNYYPESSGDITCKFGAEGKEICLDVVPHPIRIHCSGVGKSTAAVIEREAVGEGRFSSHIGLTPFP